MAIEEHPDCASTAGLCSVQINAALASISHEHGKFRDSVFVAELARVQTIVESALNSGEFSYKVVRNAG